MVAMPTMEAKAVVLANGSKSSKQSNKPTTISEL